MDTLKQYKIWTVRCLYPKFSSKSNTKMSTVEIADEAVLCRASFPFVWSGSRRKEPLSLSSSTIESINDQGLQLLCAEAMLPSLLQPKTECRRDSKKDLREKWDYSDSHTWFKANQWLPADFLRFFFPLFFTWLSNASWSLFLTSSYFYFTNKFLNFCLFICCLLK